MIYFKPAEYRCRCRRADCPAPLELHPRLEALLDLLRGRAGPLTISSGLRCPFWNERVGGKPDSEHLSGHAVDLRADTPQARFALVEAALFLGFRRIGIGKTFVHVGVSKSHPSPVIWLY